MIVRLSLSHTGVCSALCRAVWRDGYGGLISIIFIKFRHSPVHATEYVSCDETDNRIE
jgi:Na+-translocating ferredoxin:NAD+ oxidoreductase RnfG subunit